jgi:phenylacetate-CoA ligase
MTATNTIRKLNAIISHASNAPLYKVQLPLPEKKLTSLNEFQKTVPFTLKQDLRDAYPYGGLAVSRNKIMEIHTSSGTSGRPVGSFLTKLDVEEGSREIGKAWSTFGVDEKSIVMFAMSYGLYSGASINTYAVQSLGAFVIPASIIPIDKYIDLILDYGVTHIVGVPGFYYYLYAKMLERGVDPKQTSLTTMIAAGETYSEATRQEIQNMFNTTVFDHYGLVEINTGICFECPYKNGLHILDDYVYAEVLNFSDSANPIPTKTGEKGELVLTNLNKEASPVLRYRTGDVVINLGKKVCECGRTTQKISRIQGRVDSVVSIKGVKLDPYALRRDIQEKFTTVKDGMISFRVQKNRIHYTPVIIVTLEDPSHADILKKHVYQLTSLRFDVQHAPIEYWFINKNKAPLVEYVED